MLFDKNTCFCPIHKNKIPNIKVEKYGFKHWHMAMLFSACLGMLLNVCDLNKKQWNNYLLTFSKQKENKNP